MLKQSYHAAKASVSEDAYEQKLSIHCHWQSASLLTHRLPFSRTRQFPQQLYDEWCQPSPMEQPQQLATTCREIGTTSVFRQAAAQPVVPNTHVLARLPDERNPRPVDGHSLNFGGFFETIPLRGMVAH